MAGVVNDQGLQDWLNDLIVGAVFSAMKCRLFVNNHTPVVGDASPAVYTEAAFTGYVAVTLSGWSAATVSGHVATTVSATVTFTLTAGTATIYGAFLTNSAGTRLEGAQLDPNAPVTLNTTVSVYQVVVSVTLQSA